MYASFRSGKLLLGRAIRVYGFKIDVGRGMKGEVGGVIGSSGQWTRCHCGVKGKWGRRVKSDGAALDGGVNIRIMIVLGLGLVGLDTAHVTNTARKVY